MPKPTAHPTRYETDAKERHAAVEAASAERRKGRKAPRRDDVARVALSVVLMQYRGSKHDAARATVRATLLELLGDAGFDPGEAGRAFDAMVPRVGEDLDGYLCKRDTRLDTRNAWRARNGLPALPRRSAAD